jgi:copper homeostasis protein
MVRQRAGNFYYSSQEVKEMIDQIETYKAYPIEGVVLGLLDAQRNIDIEHTTLLARHAFPLKVTFHKAIDYSSDLLKSAEELTQIPGITSILTSGGMATAEMGQEMIRNIIDVVSGKMEVIACGKVTSGNLPALHKLIDSTAYHGKRIV